VYVRVSRSKFSLKVDSVRTYPLRSAVQLAWRKTPFGDYDDSLPDARTISSRRVEQAVETADFLRLCESEGLWVEFGVGEWSVSEGRLGKDDFLSISGEGPTLREAYFRFRSLCPKEA
jgi:hypothetical protein